MKRVLLTGVGGFIGAHCLEYFLDNTDWFIIGLDSWRHKGDFCRLNDVIGKEKLEYYKDRFILYKHDLSTPFSPQFINLLLNSKLDRKGATWIDRIDYIFNVASDSAVERSNTDPTICWRNNTELILNMLEFARIVQPKMFLHCSTDEVYGQAELNQSHQEWDKIIPSNVYSASKAAQEALCVAYWRVFDVPVVITNSINNYGEGQDPEKFIPRTISNVLQNKEMPIYGDSIGNIGTRFYLHAKDHADAFIFLSQFAPTMYEGGKNQLPDKYNIGSMTELSNLEIAQVIAWILHKELKWKLIPSEIARKGYDKRYALNITKLKNLGWTPKKLFDESIKNVVNWTLAHPNWGII